MAKKIRTFDDIIGHKNLLSFLKRHVKEDNIADVVIFYGNSGIGKSSIAKLLAIDVVTRHESDELKQKYIKELIEEDKPTDSIKVFNMSEIQEKEEKIQEVKSELTLGFSKTRRKVLILDEAHNMSKAAQDAILTELESLDEGIYVFICTTEINALRSALRSRCKAPFRLHDLTEAEARMVVRKVIEARHLSFDVNVNMVISLICDWADNQPRKMCNLLENFEDGSLISSRDLEVFINMNTAPAVIELLKYLYGSMTLGIEYINSLQCDDALVSMLIEVCKVAMGHTSTSISPKDALYIKDFMNGRDDSHIMKFTATVAGIPELRRHKVISAFMQCHISYERGSQPSRGQNSMSRMEDINTLTQSVENADVYNLSGEVPRVKSLAEMFGNAEVIEEEVVLPHQDTLEVWKNLDNADDTDTLCSTCGSVMLSTGKCSNHNCVCS